MQSLGAILLLSLKNALNSAVMTQLTQRRRLFLTEPPLSSQIIGKISQRNGLDVAAGARFDFRIFSMKC